jgi:hypothetical protein
MSQWHLQREDATSHGKIFLAMFYAKAVSDGMHLPRSEPDPLILNPKPHGHAFIWP